MTSLEFIEKEIKYEKENIKLWTPKKETSGRLNHLHRIKNILEAWEVVKNSKIQIKETFVDKDCNDLIVINVVFKEQDFGKFEKALEVNNVD